MSTLVFFHAVINRFTPHPSYSPLLSSTHSLIYLLNCTHRHIDTERCQNKPPQGVYVIQPYETHSTDPISLDFIQGQQGDGQGPWEAPGNRMEEEGFLLNGLAAPFRHSSQEPSDCQYDPPHTAGHSEEIQNHEEQGACLREKHRRKNLWSINHLGKVIKTVNLQL